MDIWLKALVLQGGIWVAAWIIGIVGFRLSARSTALAILLASPVPLLRVSPGVAGFIFAADLVAVWFVVRRLMGAQDTSGDSHTRTLRWLALLMLFILPLFSTILGFMNNIEDRWMKSASLGIARGFAYYVMFTGMMRYARKEPKPDSMLALQCIVFALIAVCGIAQYAVGLDLDLWNTTRQLDVQEGQQNYGGGFMGLYRGAVGAWGIGILGIAPVVFARRGLAGLVLTTAIELVVMAAILAVGSRQGAVIGVAALLIGYAASVRTMPWGTRLRAFARGVGSLGLTVILVLVGWGSASPYSFQKYVTRRFDFILDPYRTTQAIRSRSAVMPVAWENITSNPQTFVAGVGYGMEQLHAYGAGPKLVYVDCEILMVWQIGGTLLIAAYGTYLLFLRIRLRSGNWPPSVSERACIGAAIVAMYGGIMLMYGHFFILTTYSHEAPIAYWNLALFGMAVAACSRPREEASVEGEEWAMEEPEPARALAFN